MLLLLLVINLLIFVVCPLEIKHGNAESLNDRGFSHGTVNFLVRHVWLPEGISHTSGSATNSGVGSPTKESFSTVLKRTKVAARLSNGYRFGWCFQYVLDLDSKLFLTLRTVNLWLGLFFKTLLIFEKKMRFSSMALLACVILFGMMPNPELTGIVTLQFLQPSWGNPHWTTWHISWLQLPLGD